MAKPFKPSPKPVTAPAAASKSQPVKATEVRNSAIPRVAAAAPKAAPATQITREQIAERAYYISQSGTGGSEFDNWVRAERELRGGR